MLSLLPLLMLNPPLQLMLMPGMDMAMVTTAMDTDMDMATDMVTVDTMDMDTTMARGLLMLSLLPGMDMDMVVMVIMDMVITDMVIMVMDMVMSMDTTVESKTLSWLGVTQVVTQTRVQFLK